jgi:hypothetical protein
MYNWLGQKIEVGTVVGRGAGTATVLPLRLG